MKLLIITQKVDQNDQLLGFFIDWLKRFAEKFEKITVLCLEKGDFDLPENVKVFSLGKDRGASKLKQLFTFYSQLYNLRREYDAVFVHMNPIWIVLGSLFWRLLSKKIYFWYTHKAVTLKLRLAEKMADTIFTASEDSFRLLSDKVNIIGHGIDTWLFQPSENLKSKSEKLMIFSVGRIAPVKNYETLIDAAKILKDEGVEFLVTMVGEVALNSDTRYLESLKLKIKSLNLENNFNFVGKIINKDLPSYYQSNDIFVHLSKTGSLDKVILEAMACGMKTLSSNDSAKAFLPASFIFNEDNSSELAEKIITLGSQEVDLGLREYVAQNHNLDKLINKISSVING